MYFILAQAPVTVYCKKKSDLGQEECSFFFLRMKIDVHEFLNNIEEVRIQLQMHSSNNRLKGKFSLSEILNKKMY